MADELKGKRVAFLFTEGAEQVEVSPVMLELPAGAASTVLTVANRGTQRAAIQVRGFEWKQSPTEDPLSPTGALLISPPLFELEPGETQVVRLHSGNGVHDEMDRRAVACFDQALDDVGLSADGRLRQVLHDYFAWATSAAMARYPDSPDDVPAGLSIPQWSWDGPARSGNA